MSEENKPLNVFQRINEVRKAVAYIIKDKQVDAGGPKYMVVTHDAVTAILRPHLIEQGIIVSVSQVSGEMLEMRDLTVDRKMHLYSGGYSISFINMDNPEDRHVIFIDAHAADNGDKAPGKCASYAVKVAMLKTFSLETGENEESRYAETELFTSHQKARFDELLDTADGIGFASFSQEVGEMTLQALCGTFPKGKVSAGKKLCKELETQGWDVINDYAMQIREGLKAEDDMAVLQLKSELEPIQKRLVAGLLNEQELIQLKAVGDTV